jgi:hypothetical protein
MIQTSSVPVTTRQDGSPLQLNDVWINTNNCSINKWNGTQWFQKPILLVQFSANTTVNANATFGFNSKVTDTSNSYNTSTFEYIVPSTGVYVMSMQGVTTGANIGSSPTVYINGSLAETGWFASDTCGIYLTLLLNQGNIVTIRQGFTGANTYSAITSQYSIFQL